MRKTTHIASIAELAITLHNFSGNRRNGEAPIATLASFLGLSLDGHQFVRILTWVIAFYQEGETIIRESDLTEKNKSAAISNLKNLFQPFLPPFSGQMQTWFNSAMSQTNQSYYDLLSDSLRKQHSISIPDSNQIAVYAQQLSNLLVEMKRIELPKWISDDFSDSISLTIQAIEKIPFIAHRVLYNTHSSIIASLFFRVSSDHKKFIVKVATTVNIVFAAFVMPHEASEAGQTYYEWMASSAISQEQIDACARPLALPAPSTESN